MARATSLTPGIFALIRHRSVALGFVSLNEAPVLERNRVGCHAIPRMIEVRSLKNSVSREAAHLKNLLSRTGSAWLPRTPLTEFVWIHCDRALFPWNHLVKAAHRSQDFRRIIRPAETVMSQRRDHGVVSGDRECRRERTISGGAEENQAIHDAGPLPCRAAGALRARPDSPVNARSRRTADGDARSRKIRLC